MKPTHWRDWYNQGQHEAAVKQMMYVRDRMMNVLARTHEEFTKLQDGVCVIGSHTSGSIRLPVLHFVLDDGTEFTLRNNFNDWKVSVKAPRDVRGNFMGLFNETQEHHAVYCEGFPREMVYGPYAADKRRFTIALSGNEELFMFFWIFNVSYDHRN